MSDALEVSVREKKMSPKTHQRRKTDGGFKGVTVVICCWEPNTVKYHDKVARYSFCLLVACCNFKALKPSIYIFLTT